MANVARPPGFANRPSVLFRITFAPPTNVADVRQNAHCFRKVCSVSPGGNVMHAISRARQVARLRFVGGRTTCREASASGVTTWT